MAKVYETKEDLDREQLAQQVKEARDTQYEAGTLAGLSSAALIFGLIMKKSPAESVAKSEKFIETLSKELRGGGTFRMMGAIGTALGGWEILSQGKKIRKLETQQRKLGPERIIIKSNPDIAQQDKGWQGRMDIKEETKSHATGFLA